MTAHVGERPRPARPDEAAQLSDIAFASKAHWGYSAEVMDGWREDLAITPEEIARCPTFVCERQGVAIGFAQLVVAEDVWHLEHLWVHPQAIGLGAGRQLLAHAVAHAAAAGATELRIDADPNAEAFYLARGARLVGAVPAPLPGDSARARPQLRLALIDGDASAKPE